MDILDPKIKEDFLEDLDKFLAKKDWYLTRNLTFKRGYLFFGKPRNGKSALIAAVARKYKRDIYFLNLNSIQSEEQLLEAFMEMRSDCILVVEDIDAVWDKRKLVNKECKISFSTFINLLSGVLEKEDILTFFTTNHIEKLDPALIGDRRIDKKVEIPHPKKPQAEEYFTSAC